jgi:hypothetical protein
MSEELDLRRLKWLIPGALLLELLAISTGEIQDARWQRVLWPFNDAAMFTADGYPGSKVMIRAVLLDGEKEIPIDWGELIHPARDVGRMPMVFRFRRTPVRWNDELSQGLVKSAHRLQCAKSIRADSVAVQRVDFPWEEATKIGRPSVRAKTELLRLPLPPCEGAP